MSVPQTGLYSLVVGHKLDKHCRKAGDRVVTAGAGVEDCSGIFTVVVDGPDVNGGKSLNILGLCLCGLFCCQLSNPCCSPTPSSGNPKLSSSIWGSGDDSDIARMPAENWIEIFYLICLAIYSFQ